MLAFSMTKYKRRQLDVFYLFKLK